MLSQKASRWFGLLILLMLALRLGYKYYRSQQRPAYETQLESAQARSEALVKRMQARQDAARAGGATVVVADSAVLAPDPVRVAE